MKTTLGLTLLLFATLFSCMRQEKPLPAELSRAESVMWEHPDSALLCLSSLCLRLKLKISCIFLMNQTL